MPSIQMERNIINTLTEKDIKKLIDIAITMKTGYEKLQKYYEGDHKILEETKRDPTIPNNKLVSNMPKYITDTATGYFMGKPVAYSCDNEMFMEKLQEIYDYNDEQDENSELEKKCSILGHCYEMLYVDMDGWIRFDLVRPENALFIYETGTHNLMAVIRFLESNNIITNIKTYYAEFWNNSCCMYFESSNSTSYTLKNVIDHYWKDVPFVEYMNNEECRGDFEGIISLVDAYNRAQSNTANLFQYNDQAILTITNMGDVSTDDVKDMKEKGSVILEDQGEMKWLTKEINDAALENYKKRLREDMHLFSSIPNMTDDSFGSQLSGVAISYKMYNFEQLVVTKERKFKKALQRRVELIANILNLLGGSYDYKDVKMTFRRNMPQNISEMATVISTLRGFISDHTLMEYLPNIENAQDELDRRNDEDVQAMKKLKSDSYGNLKEDPEPDE